jgi:predicted Zn-dependent peptidase
VGRRALGEETNLGQTGVATVEVEGVLDSFAEFQGRLSSVTPAAIQRAAEKWLEPRAFTLIVLAS